MVICSSEWDHITDALSGHEGLQYRSSHSHNPPFPVDVDLPVSPTQSWSIRSDDLCFSADVLQIIGEGLLIPCHPQNQSMIALHATGTGREFVQVM